MCRSRSSRYPAHAIERSRSSRCLFLAASFLAFALSCLLLAPSLDGQPIYLEAKEVSTPSAGDGLLGLTTALSSTHLAMGAPWRTIDGQRRAGAVEIADSAGTYLFTIDNPTPETASLFGNALAIDDGVLAIGASHADRTFGDSGVVYLYDLAGQQIAAPIENPGSSGFFGRELALTGDGELIVAAIGPPGALYRFDLAGVEVASQIANPDPAAFPIFGTALAVTPQGDVLTTGLSFPFPGGVVYRFSANGALLATTFFDDASELYVTSASEGDSLVCVVANGAGRVLRYNRAGRLVTSYATPSPEAFGRGLAQLSGMVAVGAPKAAGGTVFLFDDAGTLKRTITPLNAASGAEFGRTLAVHGQTLAIGAPATDTNVIAKPTIHLLVPATRLCNRPIEDYDQILLGTDGNDDLTGGPGDDLIVLFDGDDGARGRGGDDCLLGGRGRDRLRGNRGIDHLDGGPGDNDQCTTGEILENCEE